MLFLLQGLLLWLVAHLYAMHTNTLAVNGRWVASKTALDKRVMGAQHFALSQRLEGEHLDLGRWHGFQEVLHGRPLAPTEIAFDFKLSEAAYLIFVFNKTDAGFSGLRLGRDPRLPDVFFVARADGEFLSVQPIESRALDGGWKRLRVTFAIDGVSAWIDDRPLGSFAVPIAERHVFGFRGGLAKVLVDDVQVRSSHAAEGFEESFDNPRAFRKVLSPSSAGLVSVNLLLVWLAVHVKALGQRRLMFVGLTTVLTLLTCLTIYLLAHRAFLAEGYFARPPEREADFKEREIAALRHELGERYSSAPAAGTVRVMFLGTSQTWGAGALQAEDAFPSVVERLLNAEAPPGRRFECVNASVSGSESSRLAELYVEDWVKLSPHLLVVNLSSNDGTARTFSKSLEVILDTSRQHGVKTLFVLEANSFEHRPELSMHATMRRVALRHGIPVVDMHHELEQSAREGLIWWDFVHPTSFGHRLIAERLAPEIYRMAESLPR